jgi:hypothetical protein
MQRYAFSMVRRARAPVLGPRKLYFFHGLAIPVENMKENDALWAFAR